MKMRIHRSLAALIAEGCEGRLNIKINKRWFALGSIYPDCTHQRFIHMHEIGAAGNMVARMIHRFCKKSLCSGQNLSWWRSLRLGIVMHYVCDFFCYVHTVGFGGSLLEHRAYEQQQGALKNSIKTRDICSFYGINSPHGAVAKLIQVISKRQEDSYSPAKDLDYALAVGIELAFAMLRISMNASARPMLRHRVLFYGRCLIKKGVYLY